MVFIGAYWALTKTFQKLTQPVLLNWSHVTTILFQSEDVLKFACIDFSSQHQKEGRRSAYRQAFFRVARKAKGAAQTLE